MEAVSWREKEERKQGIIPGEVGSNRQTSVERG